MKVGELIELLKHENQENEISILLNFKTKDRKLPCGFVSFSRMNDKEGFLHDRGKSIFILELKKEHDENYIGNSL